MQLLHQCLARELAADRLRQSRQSRVSQTLHPPSPVRRRVASAVARLAIRLDADAARVAVK